MVALKMDRDMAKEPYTSQMEISDVKVLGVKVVSSQEFCIQRVELKNMKDR